MKLGRREQCVVRGQLRTSFYTSNPSELGMFLCFLGNCFDSKGDFRRADQLMEVTMTWNLEKEEDFLMVKLSFLGS